MTPGTLDLGACDAAEAVRRLAAVRLLGGATAAGNCWSKLAHLPDFARLSVLATAPTLRDEEAWTLTAARTGPACHVRWYALRQQAARVATDTAASLATMTVVFGRAEDDGTPCVRTEFNDVMTYYAVAGDDHDAASARKALDALGTRYQQRLVVGSKVIARMDVLGAKPGDIGIVYEVYDRGWERGGKSEGYGIIFSNMGYDGFSPDEVDWLVDVAGEISDRYRPYEFRHVGTLHEDFAQPAEFTLLPHTLATGSFVSPARYAW